eukprot:GHVU01181770.1.p1 GENE.GHVU01181770.1~~GHVU01181770.1.p1  ORF type:complete len:180 (+),score=25.35 GHVU01181770.1:341-880(+)
MGNNGSSNGDWEGDNYEEMFRTNWWSAFGPTETFADGNDYPKDYADKFANEVKDYTMKEVRRYKNGNLNTDHQYVLVKTHHPVHGDVWFKFEKCHWGMKVSARRGEEGKRDLWGLDSGGRDQHLFGSWSESTGGSLGTSLNHNRFWFHQVECGYNRHNTRDGVNCHHFASDCWNQFKNH